MTNLATSDVVKSVMTAIVPASGVAGWLGSTTSGTSLMAGAAIAGSTVATATLAAGGSYLWFSLWKRRTKFEDPCHLRFMEGEMKSLTSAERTQKSNTENNVCDKLLGNVQRILIHGSHLQQAGDDFVDSVLEQLTPEWASSTHVDGDGSRSSPSGRKKRVVGEEKQRYDPYAASLRGHRKLFTRRYNE
jgi:hypothetical protein